MLKKLLSKLINKHREKRANDSILSMDWIDVKNIVNVKPKQIKNIVFVIPGISAYSGGITSILRLGTYLSKKNYNVTYASINESKSVNETEADAKLCLADFIGTITHFSKIVDNKNFDIVIATSTVTVYYAMRIHGYKMTFVQDYEPYFEQAGDWHFLAAKSYDLGFHMVSLGAWNKSMILKQINENLQVDVITFPYEKSEYSLIERDFNAYKDKNEFKLCIYIRETPRRLPGICQLIAKKLQEKFEEYGKKLEVLYFGSNNTIYKYGKNLGQLNKSQLNCLYQSCDFGMVASYTNISLVPYEMMATGLPIIEIKNGSFPFFFEDAAFLFDLDYDALFEELKTAIDNPIIFINRNIKIQKILEKLSWKDTAEEFVGILNNVVAIDG